MLLSEGVFLSLNFMEGLFDLSINFRGQIIFDFHALHFQKKIFFFFEFIEFFPNIRINKISDVFTIEDFWDNIIFPVFWNDVMLLKWNAENTGASLLFFDLSDCLFFWDFFA